MSYEKLGFEKGQVLKAEHLNHMEEGIEAANAGGGAGFVYYTGNLTLDNSLNCFTLNDLTTDDLINNYYEIEFGLSINDTSNMHPSHKFTFVIAGDRFFTFEKNNAVENDSRSYLPEARLIHTNDNRVALQLYVATGSYAIPVYNPSMIYIRMYPRG